MSNSNSNLQIDNTFLKYASSMFEGIDTLLFDLDGTLVDSMMIWRQIDLDFLESRKIDLDPVELQKNIEGLSMIETAQYFIDTFDMTESVDELTAIWDQMAIEYYKTKVNMQPHALEFLKKAHESDYKLAIASSNSSILIETVMKARGMDKYIDLYVTANEVAHGKPFPDVYLEAAKRLDSNPATCIVFEDIVAGVKAGLNAGMKTIAFDDLYSRYGIEEKSEISDYLIDDYNQIIDYL